MTEEHQRFRYSGLIDSNALGFFNPLSVSNLSMWLDASQIVGLGDGDYVSTWEDSGGNNDAIQTITANKPIYKLDILNSLPVVRFDGNDDMYMNGMDAGDTITLFCVIIPTGGTSFSGLFDSAPSQVNVFRNYAAGKFQWWTYAEVTLNIPDTNPVLLTFRTSINPCSAIDYYRNGLFIDTFISTPSLTATMAWNNPRIGSINVSLSYYTGDIAEIVLYSKRIIGEELDKLHYFFNNKYNLWT